jgi:hypothetical protein
VLRSLLGLFKSDIGPVLADYGRDAPDQADDDVPWSCPLPLPPLDEATTKREQLTQALQSEAGFLIPWFEEGLSKRGRTLFGVSGLTLENVAEMAAFVAAFAVGETPEPIKGANSNPMAALRPIVDDLKTFYQEAAAEQPGASRPNPYAMNRWFYYETRLGDALYDIRDVLTARLEALPPENRPPPVNVIPNMFRERPAKN